MYIKIPKALVEAIGFEAMEPYGVQKREFNWKKHQEISLARMGQKSIRRLMGFIQAHDDIRGAKTILKDCELWIKALEGGGAKPRSVKQFESMLKHKLVLSGDTNRAEGRPAGVRVYEHDEERNVWWCYAVSKTEYTPERRERDYYYPAHADIILQYTEFGGRDSTRVSFQAEDCLHQTVDEALAARGLLVENEELRAEYERRAELFHRWVDQIGKQFYATGAATDDLDGNGKGRRDTWYWSRTQTVTLDKAGEPARVVIDVFQEDDAESRRRRERYSRDTYIDKAWWERNRPAVDKDDALQYDDEGDLIEIDPEDDRHSDFIDEVRKIDYDELPEPEVPIHPMMAVFDLSRHLRLKVDVGQLTEYKYDLRLGDKLILPSDSRNLVEMLLAHKGQFRDIVKGKSGGAIILCAGIPGTGKTLTAEVYAEVMARPLYTVQASQLGTDPDDLEDELLKTFARASRWNAIMLLDEADVYVHTRGNGLTQNAIVGVFLRVLEYYKGVLFLTTNRSDLVDDAIASRCVARIDYAAPTAEDQRKIWDVLCDTAGVKIDPEVIDAAVGRYPDLTGRDVKNILKLAQLVSESRECPITLDIIRFVKRFKPTVSSGLPEVDDSAVTLPPMPDWEAEPAEVETVLMPSVAAPPANGGNGKTAPEPDNGRTKHDADDDWKRAALAVFNDGAPHAPSEAKEAVTAQHPDVHPNAVTNALCTFVKNGWLARLESGLYRSTMEN